MRPLCESNESLKLLNDVLFSKNLTEIQQPFGLNGQQATKRPLSTNNNNLSQNKRKRPNIQTPDKLMVIGGSNDRKHFTIETYCPLTKTWTLSNEKVKLNNFIMKIFQHTLIGTNLYITAPEETQNYQSVSLKKSN